MMLAIDALYCMAAANTEIRSSMGVLSVGCTRATRFETHIQV